MPASREYRLLNRVAETDFAETYRAVTTQSGEHAQPALVHLLMPRATEAEVLRRIKQHLAALSATRSPNLLMPWGFGRAKDRWAIAVPCPPGHFLDMLLTRVRAREFSVPLPRAVQLIAEAANGLAALHSRGIFHGGIGPDDVLLAFDGSVGLQCDGLRFVLESLRSTRHLAWRGRKRYRAPELARGTSAGASCDVFALGVVAFELITGHAFEGATRAGSAIRSDSVQLPSRLDRRIPAKFDQVLIRAVESAPARRYSSGAELRDALWEYLDSMGQVVTPAELAEVAATVMPNEVVTRAFDPKEQPTAAVPVSGTFSIEASAISDAASPASPYFDEGFSPRSPSQEGSPGISGAEVSERDSTIKLTIPSLDDDVHTDAGDSADADDDEEHDYSLDTSAGATDDPPPEPAAARDCPEDTGEDLAGEVPKRAYFGAEGNIEVEASLGAMAFEEPHEAEPRRPDASPLSHDESWAHGEEALVDDGDTDTERAIPNGPRAAGDGSPRAWPPTGGARTARRDGAQFLSGVLALPVPFLVVVAVAIVFGAVGFTVGRVTAPSALVPPPGFLTAPPAQASAAGDETSRAPEQPKQFDVFSLLSDASAAAAKPPPPPQAAPAEEPTPVVAKAAPEPSKQAATPRRGRITIQSNQRAKVFIDGRDTGRYTPLRGYRVRAGRREVTLVTDDGKTRTRTVVVRANQVNPVRINLQ